MIQDRRARFAAPEIVLPRIESELARLWARLADHRIDGQLELGGQAWSYVQAPEGNDGAEKGTIIGLTVDGQPVSLCLSTDATQWIESLDSYFEPFAKLDPGLLALVFEHVLADDIQRLEDAWGKTIAIRSVQLGAMFDTESQLAGFAIKGDARAAQFNAFMDATDRPGIVEELTGSFPKRERRDLRHLKTPTVILGPIATLREKNVLRLREGSVFFPHADWKPAQHLPCYFGWGRNIVRVNSVDGGLAINGPEEDLGALVESHAQGGRTMSRGADSGRDPTTVVTVELSREEMSISEIEGIRKGAVINFDFRKVEEVTLTAGGQPIAEGRLVQLDDTVGVQITRLL